MKKYTIVAAYKDGLYISQTDAINEIDSLFSWLKSDQLNDIPHMTPEFKKLLHEKFKIDYHQLVKLDALENVFCTSCTIDGELFLVNIIETVV